MLTYGQGVDAFTRKLWDKQNQHTGDRERLFRSVAKAIPTVKRALYAGSFVDVAASFAWPSVTYIDIDKRMPRFFGDTGGVAEILTENGVDPETHEIQFIHSDYSADLGLSDESFDLVISLYAGLISVHCTRFLRIGGFLLVNPSHGDAAMASIDPRYKLAGVVISRDSKYRVSTSDLDAYLIPKKPQSITTETLHETGRGIGYTTSPFAYLFTRIA